MTIFSQKFLANGVVYKVLTGTQTVEVTNPGKPYTGAIIIPDSVNYAGVNYSVVAIGNVAFRNSRSLTAVTIPQSVRSIGANAFNGCKALRQLVIPNHVTHIGKQAFENCSQLSSVNIPDSLTQILEKTFNGCASLANITIPVGVGEIGQDAFAGCSALAQTQYKGQLSDWCQIQFGNQYANPISASHNLYINNTALTSLTIPDSITEVKNYAFVGCDALLQIDIPRHVLHLGESAFAHCTSLVDLSLTDALISVGSQAFEASSTLDTVTLYLSSLEQYCVSPLNRMLMNAGVTAPRQLILNDTILNQLNLPQTISSIADYAFYGCTDLQALHIPSNITAIGEAAFSSCSSLDTIVIPESVRRIEPLTFHHCDSLRSVTIPQSVVFVGRMAFAGCSSLDSLHIPSSVTAIGENAFDDTPLYTSLADGVVYINQILYTYKGQMPDSTTIVVKPGTFTINAYAFRHCNTLDSIVLPATVHTIGNAAFDGCSKLRSIHLPNAVHTIGNAAFAGCTALELVTIPQNVKLFHRFEKITKKKTPNASILLRSCCILFLRFLSNLLLISGVNSYFLLIPVLSLKHILSRAFLS
jgi:hypothetical protein